MQKLSHQSCVSLIIAIPVPCSSLMPPPNTSIPVPSPRAPSQSILYPLQVDECGCRRRQWWQVGGSEWTESADFDVRRRRQAALYLRLTRHSCSIAIDDWCAMCQPFVDALLHIQQLGLYSIAVSLIINFSTVRRAPANGLNQIYCNCRKGQTRKVINERHNERLKGCKWSLFDVRSYAKSDWIIGLAVKEMFEINNTSACNCYNKTL